MSEPYNEDAERNRLAKQLKKEQQRLQGNNSKPKKPQYISRHDIDFSDRTLFTDENDHNPIVQKICHICNGRSRRFSEKNGVHSDFQCHHCRGVGSVNEPSKLFEDDTPPVELKVGPEGWLKCPNCERRFNTRDKQRWTGWRHKCGQRIKINK
jgi:hypothetical protein